MASWEGFSESDLQRIKGVGGAHAKMTGESPEKKKASSLGQNSRKPNPSASARARKAASQPPASASSKQHRMALSLPSVASSPDAPTVAVVVPNESPTQKSPSPTTAAATTVPVDVDLRPCTEDDINTIKKTRFEEVHEQQKKLEKINLVKKAELLRTIAQRKQEAERETQHLGVVQKELSRLDSIVSTDVSIIRERIESATTAYNDAKRRYDAAEAEFVAAKMHVHRCSEQKELLMEHLVTVIEQTETRKADKLSELMGSLNGAEVEKAGSRSTGSVPPAEPAAEESAADQPEQEEDEEEEEIVKPPITLLGLAQQSAEETELAADS